MKCDTAITEACDKGRKTLNSLINVGLHANGMSPLYSKKIIEKVILPGTIYGCELWNNPTQLSIDKLNRTQRYEARRCLGLDQQSSTLLTTQCLGINDICNEIEYRKLSFFNKLCNSSIAYIWKMLFIIRLCDFLFDTRRTFLGFIPDICNILSKYGMTSFVRDFIIYNQYPNKFQWKVFIKNTMYNYVNTTWRQDVSSKPELARYGSVHTSIGLNPVLALCKDANNIWHIVEFVKLCIDKIREEATCKLCSQNCTDICYHFIIECPSLCYSRDKMFNVIVRNIDANMYSEFEALSNNDKCDFIMGSRASVDLQDETWCALMIKLATEVHNMFVEMDTLLN